MRPLSARQLGWSATELAEWSTGLSRQQCGDHETFSLDSETEAAPATGAKSVIHCRVRPCSSMFLLHQLLRPAFAFAFRTHILHRV